MPKKIQNFARSALVNPGQFLWLCLLSIKTIALNSVCLAVTINVGRAGAANLDVIQEVEYVKQEAKIVYLLECLQKTAPPVSISCILFVFCVRYQ